MKENMITITLEDGTEKDFEILLTFDLPDYQKNYVAYFDPELDDEETEILVSSFDPNDESGGALTAIEEDAEWEQIEEVIMSFIDEMEDEE